MTTFKYANKYLLTFPPPPLSFKKILIQVAAQLGAMRDENRRMWDQLTNEKRKVEKLVTVVGRLWDVVGKGFPGHCQSFFLFFFKKNQFSIFP